MTAYIELPTALEALQAVEAGSPTPLESFIYWNEPVGHGQQGFREKLALALEYVCHEKGAIY